MSQKMEQNQPKAYGSDTLLAMREKLHLFGEQQKAILERITAASQLWDDAVLREDSMAEIDYRSIILDLHAIFLDNRIAILEIIRQIKKF